MSVSVSARSRGGAAEPQLYRPFASRIERVQDLTPKEKLFRLVRLDGKPFGQKPGQFVQVSLAGIGEAPISVSSSPTRGAYLELGVRNTGTLTGALHQLGTGAEIGLRGPFGTHFPIEDMRGRDLVLISGGCGLAPMRALIQYVEDRRDDFGAVTVLYGAKSPEDVLYKEELHAWQSSDRLTCRVTVDGVPGGTCWDGPVGVVTKLIEPLALDPANTIAVIVGPPIMYRFVIEVLYEKSVPDERIIVSLERYMKCGVGKCGHCTIDHLYCCLDGPVFRLDQVRTVKGAI